MALTFKTPGVYLQEISKLPPSVAEVETAIPAFIGYTQIAKNKTDGDLNLVPTRITSLLEYEQYFGGAANETGISVEVDGDGTIIVDGPANRSPFIMYYNMQMYFANGGGPCYITSVGQYLKPASGSPATDVAFANLEDGLDEIKKQDEPTLLVFPDAVSLDNPNQLYALYTKAMEQCRDLQDRFTILDTYNDLPSSIDTLRNGITSDPLSLKYGGAYYPYLQTILSYAYLDSDVLVTDANAPSFPTQVTTITNGITSTMLEDLMDQLQVLKTVTLPAATTPPLLAAAKTAINKAVGKILTYMSILDSKIDAVDDIIAEALAHPGSATPTQIGDLTNARANLNLWATDNLNANFAFISGLNDEVVDVTNDLATTTGILGDIMEYLFMDTDPLTDPLNERVDALVATTLPQGQLPAVSTKLVPFVNSDAYLSSYELNDNIMYNRIKGEIAKINVILPPSSSMAGIYARTDANSGVWTAPANASVNYTIAPTVFIDNEMQEGMNVTTTGKSVNAIRSFTGRGTLVWGARTLTGNSNEWRYIPVRRFYNFAEESIKKASEPFVFQANDANTWVKVKGMIENFLTQQWKNGALTGAKPEQAFYVSVGLGQTMTAQDVLEGRMIVEVGMAVVRPAEFIVLKFSHKMQEA